MQRKIFKPLIDTRQLLLDHIEGIPYRKLTSRHKAGRTQLCKILNNQTAQFKNNFEITKHFSNQLTYSGNLVVDGKCVPVKETEISSNPILGKIPKSKKRRRIKKSRTIIWGADYLSHDLPHFEFGESESSWAFNNYFAKLKFLGYPLISVTVDDKQEIARAAKRHFPDCIIQLCNRHYLTKISRILAIGNIKIKIRSKEKQLDGLFNLNNSDHLPVTRWLSIKQACKLSNEIAELEFKYELLLDFQNIIESILNAEDYQIALYRIESLEKYFWPKRWQMKNQFAKEQIKTVRKLITDLKEHQEYLLNYLKYPHLNIPRTTNLIEGYNSQLELRLNSIRGFESSETAENYINAWIIKRRFSKFTDCKKYFKNLNGKTPLECADVDISDILDWIKFCQK